MNPAGQDRRTVDRAFGAGFLVGLAVGYGLTLAIFLWIVANSG